MDASVIAVFRGRIFENVVSTCPTVLYFIYPALLEPWNYFVWISQNLKGNPLEDELNGVLEI